MISSNLSAIFYLISGILFILALRGLSSPETSRQGNFFGILGMIIAIAVTFLTVGNFSTAMNKLIKLVNDLGINLRDYNEDLADTVDKFTNKQMKLYEQNQQ